MAQESVLYTQDTQDISIWKSILNKNLLIGPFGGDPDCYETMKGRIGCQYQSVFMDQRSEMKTETSSRDQVSIVLEG